MPIIKISYLAIPAFILLDAFALPASCNKTVIKDSKNLAQESITYKADISNLNSYIRCEVKTTVRRYGEDVKLTAPSNFKIDGKKLDYGKDRYDTHYLVSFEREKFANGLHTLSFTDYNSKTITDSFWYCQPVLPEQPTEAINDSLLKVKIEDCLAAETVGCYFQKQGSETNYIRATGVKIINGYLMVPVTELLRKHNYSGPGTYKLYADYSYDTPLKSGRGKIVITGNCKKPLTLQLK